MLWKFKVKADWMGCIPDLLADPAVQALRARPHCRAGFSRYQHCLLVSYSSYALCRRLGLHAKDAARGGMVHGLTPDERASRFLLTRRERDAAARCRFPLSRPPRCRESWAVCLCDKICSLLERLGLVPMDFDAPHLLSEQPCGPGLLQIL